MAFGIKDIKPSINGVAYHWGQIKLSIEGTPIVNFTELSYKSMQDKQNLYGSGYLPTERGYGNIEFEGQLTGSVSLFQSIRLAVASKNLLTIAPFDLIMAITPEIKPIIPKITILKAVEFNEDPFEASQGDPRLFMTVPLTIGDIVEKA